MGLSKLEEDVTPEEIRNAKSAKDIVFNTRETYFYKTVDKYFKKVSSKKMDMMTDILDGKSKISLRLLDWFVTNYTDKKKISYPLTNGERFNVHISYKAQLKSYKKKYFDPFRRHNKFNYHYENNTKSVFTTIGQLNFFRWAFSNEIVEYVEKNHDIISNNMIKANKENKKKKDKKKVSTSKVVATTKKKDVNIKAKKVLTDKKYKIIISFDD